MWTFLVPLCAHARQRSVHSLLSGGQLADLHHLHSNFDASHTEHALLCKVRALCGRFWSHAARMPASAACTASSLVASSLTSTTCISMPSSSHAEVAEHALLQLHEAVPCVTFLAIYQ